MGIFSKQHDDLFFNVLEAFDNINSFESKKFRNNS